MGEFDQNNEGKSEVLRLQRVEIARRALLEYANLKPEEKVLVLWDWKTNEEMRSTIRDALAKISNVPADELQLTKNLSKRKLLKAVKGHPLIINLHTDDDSGEAALKLYEPKVLKRLGARQWALLDLSPSAFEPGGLAEENAEKIVTRLEKMEAVLREAEGLEISTSYGTQLSMRVKKGTRRWAKTMGMVLEPGQWDNLGAEVFTTPDEYEVNGILMLPVLDSGISSRQGVDEYIRLEIESGMIVSIQGGESAKVLREKLEKDARKEEKAGRDPRVVYRVAEIGFGAKAGLSLVTDDHLKWDFEGVSTVMTEKALGTIHIAFGNTDHGEEGTEGVVLPDEMHKVESHYDMVISGAGGLKVKMFTSERDFASHKNGRYLINEGISGLLGI